MTRKSLEGVAGCAALTIVLVSLLVILIPVSVVKGAEVVSFPDPNLESVLREAIGKPSGDIYDTDLASLTSLFASERGIGDLTGLEYCTSLTYLYLHDNQISDISPLTNLTNLMDLSLYINQIGDISPLASLTSLTKLFLGYNQIGDISPLTNLTNLMQLHLHANQISDISPLANLTNLKDLTLEDNQISDIDPLVDNPGIASGDTVYLNGNPLSTTSIDVYIAALEARGVIVGWDVPGSNPPNQPGNLSPTGSEISLTPLLQSTVFSDLDAGDTHLASFWQMRTSSGDYLDPVFDSGVDTENLTSIEISPDTLEYSTTYYWHVRYKDNQGAWSSWSTETSFATGPPYPIVRTYDASHLMTTSAQLTAEMAWFGTASTVTVSFVWGTTSGSPGSETTAQVIASTGFLYFELSGLTPGTTYFYQPKVVWDEGLSYGDEKRFTTLVTEPSVTTNEASNLAATSATLNGTLGDLGTADNVTVYFEWRRAGGSYKAVAVGSKDTVGEFFLSLTGLVPVTTYYFKAKAAGDGDPVYGEEKSFTTSTMGPTVTTDAASNVTTIAATLNGNLTALGTAQSVRVFFEWGLTEQYGNVTTDVVKDAIGTFKTNLAGLTAETTYHFRAAAVSTDGTDAGDDMTFTTTSSPSDTMAPVITLVTAAGITKSGVTITWTTNGQATSQVEYGLTEEYGSSTILDANLVTSHSVDLTGLRAGKTYHFRVISKNTSNNESVSSDFTFTTASKSGVTPVWPWVLTGLGMIAVICAAAFLIRGRMAQGQ